MNQTYLANLVGASQQHVSKLLNKKCRPSWEVAKRLAQVTGTTPQFWMESEAHELQAAFKKWVGRERKKFIKGE